MLFSKHLFARGVIGALITASVCHAMIACGADTTAEPGREPPDTDKPDAKVTPSPKDAGEDAIVAPPGSHCEDDTCSGHGKCIESSAGLSCDCDEGFGSNDCSTINDDYGRRVKIADDLGDPAVLKLDDDHFVVSGTRGPGNGFDFYESNDLTTWTKTKQYDPNDPDPTYRYCDIWAPDFVREGGKTWIYFSANRVSKGSSTCGGGAALGTYRASAPDGTLDFGKPEPLFDGTTGARTYYSSTACPPQGCSRAIRIDTTVYDGRLYYVFFGSGYNNIASTSITNNNDIIVHNAGPYASAEENINEAPALFERKGITYFFFSGAFFNSQYATYYMMGSDPTQLNRGGGYKRLTTPARRKNGNLLETHGHNAVSTRRGEVFNFFHVGVFGSGGNYIKRDTYRQRITFNADGTMMNQNVVTVKWNNLGAGWVYSLDLVLKDKSVVGPCLGSGMIGSNLSVDYRGVCSDANERLIHRSEIAAFRIFASNNAGPYMQVGEVPYDGYSDAPKEMTLKVP